MPAHSAERVVTPDRFLRLRSAEAHCGSPWSRARPAIAAAAAASVLVTAPVRVGGDGILLFPGGILEVVATTDGRLKRYAVEQGEAIAEGQTVAVVEQPELDQERDLARREAAHVRRPCRLNLGLPSARSL